MTKYVAENFMGGWGGSQNTPHFLHGISSYIYGDGDDDYEVVDMAQHVFVFFVFLIILYRICRSLLRITALVLLGVIVNVSSNFLFTHIKYHMRLILSYTDNLKI